MFNFKNLMGNSDLVQIVAIVAVAMLLLYLVKTYYYDNNNNNNGEGFYDFDSTSPVGDHTSGQMMSDENTVNVNENVNVNETVNINETVNENVPQPSDTDNEQPKPIGDLNEVSNVGGQYLPNQCFPKDVLSSSDLLPKDADSKYAQINPSGQGSLTGSNFLTAGFHVGINTVGSTLRNANLQLRSEPPNPQVKVCPWNQSTIEHDFMRRPLEIGGF